MKYSACLETLFQNSDITRKIYRAKKVGFPSVEFWVWQTKDIDAVKKAIDDTDMEVGIFQGNIDGQMVDPADNDIFIEGVKKSIETAKYLGTKHLFLMANAMNPDRTAKPTSRPLTDEQKLENIKTVLKRLAVIGKQNGITFVIEPLNTKQGYRHAYNVCEGYFIDHMEPAVKVVREVNSPNIKVLYDFYQMGVMEGNIINGLRNYKDVIGYLHIGDVPERYQPGTGELDYRNIFKTVREIGYRGYVGFEFECLGKSDEAAIQDVFELIG